eukprot:TRINITY_DN1840_c0_g1_i13.p1 TRINITY_DN1840_c0_g1~~TRINITY_DN1840_c0_g1_i13.p1  ORF type:complete len:168 (-),score=31.38 TRINITY_DN1840_c0_g1_i13:93-596(-)
MHYGMTNKNVKTPTQSIQTEDYMSFKGNSNINLRQMSERDLLFSNIKKDLTRVKKRIDYFTRNQSQAPLLFKRPYRLMNKAKEMRHASSHPRRLRVGNDKELPLHLLKSPLNPARDCMLQLNESRNFLGQIEGRGMSSQYSTKSMRERSKRRCVCIKLRMLNFNVHE